MITRKDYMKDSEKLHRAYFAQFATLATRQAVLRGIGKDAILTSKDESLNDIPLRKWDILVGYPGDGDGTVPRWYCFFPVNKDLIKAAGEWLSAGILIDIAKEVAKQIREGN